jgi:toxin CcdB
MAQFDVYRNNGRQREVIPFVVTVQSSLYDDYARRVVVPLVKASALGNIASPRLNPTFKIKNITVVLHPLEIVSVPVTALGERIASLKAEADRVIGSLDDLLLRVDR